MNEKRDQSGTVEISVMDVQAVEVSKGIKAVRAETEPSISEAVEPSVSEAVEPSATEGVAPAPSVEDKPHLASTPPLPRTVIDGRYEVVKSLGSGAMGTVYLVKHVRLNKLFALKMVNPDLASEPEYVSRFEREADSCSRLKHPNCISVTDFGQSSDGSLYLVMEYADGTPLSALVAEDPVTISEAIEYTRQILLGLKHAHDEGLIHRDIKLENIVKCTEPDGRVTLKILDFGMAREQFSEDDTGRITHTGVVLGTPQYMAPEQASNEKVDARVDLYAAGVTLFRLIAGKPIFPGDSLMDILVNKIRNPAPSLKDVTDIVYPVVLEGFLAKALQREPDDRFADADEMLAALDRVAAAIPGAAGGGASSEEESWARQSVLDAISASVIRTQAATTHTGDEFLGQVRESFAVPPPLDSLPAPSPISTMPGRRKPLSRIVVLLIILAVALVVGGGAWFAYRYYFAPLGSSAGTVSPTPDVLLN